MLVELVRRFAPVAKGVQADGRSGAYGELLVSDLLGRYSNIALEGRIFSTVIKTVTIAATHNSPIAAATATPVVGFLNPIGSKRAAVLLRSNLTTVSGTPAGGQGVLNAIHGVGTSITAAGAGSIFSTLLDAAASPDGSSMVPYNNTALTGLAPATGREIALLNGVTAIAAGFAANPQAEDLGGFIIVPPNSLVALMAGTGAGTTWIVNGGLTWAEIDWPI
jgi:hypothetical protein